MTDTTPSIVARIIGHLDKRKGAALTTAQLAECIGVSKKYIREWASHPALAKYRVQTNGKTNLWRKP